MLKFYSRFDPIFHFLKDKYQDKPFTIWHETFPDDVKQLEENPYNFLIIHEPNEFFGLNLFISSQQILRPLTLLYVKKKT